MRIHLRNCILYSFAATLGGAVKQDDDGLNVKMPLLDHRHIPKTSYLYR